MAETPKRRTLTRLWPRATGSEATRLTQSRVRLLMMTGVILLGYLAIGLRLVDLTLLRDAAPVMAEGQPAADIALRGTIVDRNGELVATSLKMASVYADATMIRESQKLAAALAAILPDEPAAEIAKKLSSGKKFIWIARNITPRQEYAINALGEPGLAFAAEDKRIYPHGSLTSHLVGYTDIDGRGIAGVEKFFDQKLAANEEDVELTIDLRVQHLLHRELSAARKKFKAKAAIGLVMDVKTGEIIAMVSLPDFDPYRPGAAPADARFNRATLGVYEMGSTMKLFSTAAALDAGKAGFRTEYDAREPIKYGRFTISDYHAKKRLLTVPEVFIYSSNIGTAKMALDVGSEGVEDFYRALGLLETPPLELPERGRPLYPDPWGDIHTITASFGHGIAVSPLQLVRATAALVNGGTLVTPTLIKQGGAPEKQARVVKPQTSAAIRKLLELVVASGTGSKAQVEGYHVGGKTGTAEKSSGGGYRKDLLLSSFIGVFPMTEPRYAVLAIIDEPTGTADTHGYATGGWTAAPVVSNVIAQMGPLYRIAPDFDSGRDILNEMAPYLKDKKEGRTVAAVGTDR